jgi:small neutral amino acid transporter SnatA (MarC family)
VIAAELTVTGDVPVDFNVNVCVAAVFTGTLPKLRVVAPNANCGLGAGVLVPLRATTVVEPVDELLKIVIWPLAVPVVVGRYCTCSVTTWPGFNITGRLPLMIVKPAPVMDAELTVTVDVPVDVSVNDCVVDVFTVTLPKLKVAALIVNLGLGATVLVPLKATTTVLPVDELLLIVIWPLAVPVAVGRNCTCSVTTWPGFNVTGRLPLMIVKPAPVMDAELTVTGDVPVEVSVND